MDDLLYLDPEFLAEKYEEKTGESPKTVLSKNEGMKADIGIPFLKSGLHSQITKQYSTSIQTMLKATNDLLAEYPTSIPSLEAGLNPFNLWVEGELTIGQWGNEGNSEKTLNVFFEVISKEFTYALIPKSEYFYANLETLEIISPALRRYIKIPVRLLCKVLYALPDIKTFVAAPYLITTKNG